MAKFIEREVVTMADYNEYCHYVAGLVGIGLSKVGSFKSLRGGVGVGLVGEVQSEVVCVSAIIL